MSEIGNKSKALSVEWEVWNITNMTNTGSGNDGCEIRTAHDKERIAKVCNLSTAQYIVDLHNYMLR